MSEVQKHGFDFENWIKNILGVSDIESNYTQKWDIPGKTPISVKCMGLKNALEFGSTVRFWEISRNFLLVLGRWVQDGQIKKIVSIDEFLINEKILKDLKGDINLKEIKDFDKKIKQFPAGKEGQKEGIAFAKQWKRERKARMGLLTITHKIDSKSQRRIQCNLNYTNYRKLFGEPSMEPIFRNNKFADIIKSSCRIFN